MTCQRSAVVKLFMSGSFHGTHVGEPVCVPETRRAARTRIGASGIKAAEGLEVVIEPEVHCV